MHGPSMTQGSISVKEAEERTERKSGLFSSQPNGVRGKFDRLGKDTHSLYSGPSIAPSPFRSFLPHFSER